MVHEPIKLEDLFPTAKALFAERAKNDRPHGAVPILALTMAGALVALIGYRVLRWFDRNL